MALRIPFNPWATIVGTALCAFSTSCVGPRIHSSVIRGTGVAKTAEEPIDVYVRHEDIQRATELVGEIGIGDTGFSFTYGFDQAVGYAKTEARKMGGDAILIYEQKPPDLLSTCYRIRAHCLRYTGAASNTTVASRPAPVVPQPTVPARQTSGVQIGRVSVQLGSSPPPRVEPAPMPAPEALLPPDTNAGETAAEAPEAVPTPAPRTVEAAPKPVAATPAPRAGEAWWAVVVGISDYQDTRVPTLRYAASDAQAFRDWLVAPEGGGLPPGRVNCLINKDATGANIRSALFEWLGQALAEDIVVIYFAGHGSPQSPDKPENLFLLPSDADYDRVATTGFPMWDVETALKRFIKAKRVVVIADACHSGGIGQAYDVARRGDRGVKVNLVSSAVQELSKVGDGVCVISASDDQQLSQESQEWGGGHGVFTYYLLEGLHGGADYSRDGRITLGELIPYLSEQVRRATRSAQSPTVSGKFDPALAIGQ